MKNTDNTYTFIIEKKTPIHITFRIHVNHALAGTMTLRLEEYQHFYEALRPQKVYEVYE